MKKLLFLVLMTISFHCTIAQDNDALAYEIVSHVSNEILRDLESTFMIPTKPKDPEIHQKYFKNSSCQILDYETYDISTWTGEQMDSMHYADLPKKKERYKKEIELWRIKQSLNKKVCLIASFNEKELYNERHFLEKDALLNTCLLNKPLSCKAWDGTKIENKTEYHVASYTAENLSTYKYATSIHLYLSDVSFNEKKDIATIQFASHYMIESGITGLCRILLLQKTNAGWEIVNGRTLWEE